MESFDTEILINIYLSLLQLIHSKSFVEHYNLCLIECRLKKSLNNFKIWQTAFLVGKWYLHCSNLFYHWTAYYHSTPRSLPPHDNILWFDILLLYLLKLNFTRKVDPKFYLTNSLLTTLSQLNTFSNMLHTSPGGTNIVLDMNYWQLFILRSYLASFNICNTLEYF